MIKRIIIIAILVCLSFSVMVSQNIAITDDDTYVADPSAMLDVKSINKGVLLPRLTTIQRNLVSNPATGLLVFDTDENTYYFYNGTAWVNVSADSQLWDISGAKVHLTDSNNKLGVGTNNPYGKMEVKADAGIADDVPIFHVVNNLGDTVFAVYNSGVRINVEDSPAKATSSKGGFAVGGFSPSKGGATNEYLRVTPDSVRIYIEENNPAKATTSKGGFAVGGFSPSKASINDYLSVNSDSINVSKSLYIPRMTTAERDNLGFVPSEALIIFNTTDKCMQIFENSVWSNIWCFHCSPNIITQPFDATICNGQDTSFTISATGTSLNYQWQISTDGETTWNNLSDGGVSPTYSGVNSWTLNLSNIDNSQNGFKYRCNVVSSCLPDLNSDVVSLNVGAPSLTITAQPSNQITFSGCDVAFIITTSSYGIYQWQQSSNGGSSWNNISDGGVTPIYSGATTSSLNLANVPLSYDNYQYRCIVTNLCGTGSTSNSATLTFSGNTATAATSIGHNSFFANWTAAVGALGYYIDVSLNSGFSSFVTGYNNLYVDNTTTFNVTGLNANVTYYYRVRASFSCGNGLNSNTISVSTTAFTIGESYGGGKIFYIDGTGQHGLISVTSDQGSSVGWGCNGIAISGADGTAIGTGSQNTNDIDAGCATAGIAADICANLTLNGFTDWFLPSKNELNIMFTNRVTIGGFATSYYWSSSEYDSSKAWEQSFSTGTQSSSNKDFANRVRAIRAF